jgi:predicted glycosyltransferase
LVASLHEDTLTPGRIANAILGRLALPRPEHDLDLNGAQRTRQLVDEM